MGVQCCMGSSNSDTIRKYSDFNTSWCDETNYLPTFCVCIPVPTVCCCFDAFALQLLMLQLTCYVCSHQFSSYMSTSTFRCHVTFDFPVTAVPASPIALLPCSCHFGFFFYCYSFEGDTPHQLAMSDYF